MTPVSSAGATTIASNEKSNQFLLSHIPDAASQAPPRSDKGRSIGDIAAHIHHLGLMWPSIADKADATLDPGKATGSEGQAAAAIHNLLTNAFDGPAAKVPHFKPDVVPFVAYLIAHESHHCGQIAMLARQVGHSVPTKTGVPLSEWRRLRRECGFGK